MSKALFEIYLFIVMIPSSVHQIRSTRLFSPFSSVVDRCPCVNPLQSEWFKPLRSSAHVDVSHMVNLTIRFPSTIFKTQSLSLRRFIALMTFNVVGREKTVGATLFLAVRRHHSSGVCFKQRRASKVQLRARYFPQFATSRIAKRCI